MEVEALVSFLSSWSECINGRMEGYRTNTTGIQTQLSPLKLHVNPSAIHFPCVYMDYALQRCKVAALHLAADVFSTASASAFHLSHPAQLCQHTHNRDNTATRQSGRVGVQTRRATRRLNTAHSKHASPPCCAVYGHANTRPLGPRALDGSFRARYTQRTLIFESCSFHHGTFQDNTNHNKQQLPVD